MLLRWLQLPLLLPVSLSFYIPRALYFFTGKSIYCRIMWPSLFITLLSPAIVTSVNTHVPFPYPWSSCPVTVRLGSVGLLLFIPWLFSTNFGTCFVTCCTQPPSDPPPSQGISGRGRGTTTTGKIRQIEVTESSLFCCSSHLMFHRSTHTFTFCPPPCHSRKISVDNVFLSFFNHALPKFKVRPLSPVCRVEADWLKCAAT